MRSLISFVRQFVSDESGPTAVEYAVMLAAILLAVVGAIGAVGAANSGMWNNNQQRLEEANF